MIGTVLTALVGQPITIILRMSDAILGGWVIGYYPKRILSIPLRHNAIESKERGAKWICGMLEYEGKIQ
jgi:hypothetical protein